MRRTLFDTPVITPIFRVFARICLKLLGWKVVGGLPPDKPGPHPKQSYVMIAAPHTSNWDMPYTLAVALVLDIKIFWMGKDALFPFPFRGLMMWLGGIPIDRSKANDVVAATVQQLKTHAGLIVAVPPEGTRSKVTYWKTGFYWIASGAAVPVLLGYLDFAKKEGGIARAFMPSGDIDKDMVEIKAFYAGVTGRKPQNFDAG